MIAPGDIIEHPITGETIIFRQTAATTGGKLVEADFYMRRSGPLSPPNTSTLTRKNASKSSPAPWRGGSAAKSWPARAKPSSCRPARPSLVEFSDEELHVRVEVRPALTFESFFETFFGLAQDGKVSAKTGLPNPLQMAVTLRACRTC